MKECVICGKTEKGYKLADGFICKKCSFKFPKLIKNEFKYKSSDEVQIMYGYYEQFYKKMQKFNATMTYRSLNIDETLGLICIGKKSDNNIFDVLELSDESFTQKPGRRVGNNVDCKMTASFEFSNPKIRIDNINMGTERVPLENDGDNLYITMPYRIELLENSIIELNHKKIKEWNFKVENHINTFDDEELIKAKGFYLIKGSYTKAYLKEYRAKMLKIFHPDNNPIVQIDGIIDKINDYYYLLLKELDNEESNI